VEKTLYIIAIFNTVIKRTASTKYQILKVCFPRKLTYIQIHVQGMVNNIVLVKKLPTYKQNLPTGPTTFTI
jgi:hypothetical protein